MGTKKQTTEMEKQPAEELEVQETQDTEELEVQETQDTEELEVQETQDTEEAQDTEQVNGELFDGQGERCRVTAPQGLNLRQGPGRQYAVLDVLADGDTVTVLPLPYGAEVPGWALVFADPGIGWVAPAYLEAAEE